MLVVCKGNSALVVVNMDTHLTVKSIEIGGGPDAVVYDPDLRRIYTKGRSGILSVVQQDTANSYRKIDTINLNFGAHTLALDPVTHRVYIGYLSLFVKPRLAVYGTKNRGRRLTQSLGCCRINDGSVKSGLPKISFGPR